MTIGPKKKISKASTRTRHGTRERLNLQRISDKYQVATCKQCGAKKLAYHVCPVCGYYKGKQVITIKSSDKSKVIDA